MKKNIILLGAVLFGSTAYSQVGINTETPNSTLDVSAKRDGGGILTDNAQTYGLQAPRLTRQELTSSTATYSTDQTGAIVYITDISGGNTTGQRVNITAAGYYYFDGAFWQKITNGTLPTGVDLTDDAFVNDAANTMVKLGTNADGTTARAAGTDFVVKDGGNVGIGTASPTHKLHVDGKIRGTHLTNDAANVTSDDLGLFNQKPGIYNKYVTNAAPHRFYIDGAAGNGFSGNTPVMVVGLDGNTNPYVGIGTAIPNAYLHVVSPVVGTGFRLQDTSQGNGKVLVSDADGDASWANANTLGLDNTNDEWVNDTANTMIKLGKKSDGTTNRDSYTDFVAKDDGKIGIGTSAPVSQLEVKSQITNGTIATIGNVNGANSQSLLLGVSAPASNNGAFITTGSGVANSLRLGVNGTENIRIDASTATLGNVGIGTGNTVVNYPVQVHRVGSATNTYTQHTNGQTGIAATDGLLVGVEGTTGRAIINNQENSTLSILNNGAERITVLHNGVVGIGTTTPSHAALHVNSGTAKGAFRLTDGTQGTGKVLSSDGSGNASWVTNVSVTALRYGVFGTGFSGSVSSAAGQATGTSITLSPGKWVVNSLIVLNTSPVISDGMALWTRLTWSDSTTGGGSADIVQGGLISGSLTGPSAFAMATGSTVINNATGSDKIYYLVLREVGNYGGYTGNWNQLGGAFFGEGSVVAIPAN